MSAAGLRPEARGLLALFAGHRTAANLLMVSLMVAGLFALSQLNRQFFPDFGIDIISISVEWPGASAEDVDSNIVAAIEPEVRFLDGVKRVRSSAYEGLATISVEYDSGQDMGRAANEVETAVAQVTTLPEDAERPDVRRVVRYDTVSRLVLSGPYPETTLHNLAKSLRDELLDRGVDKVDLSGQRDQELWVELEPATLRRLDLSLEDIAGQVRDSSQDLPSGTLAGGERQIRSLGLRKQASSLADIEAVALPDGTRLQLADIGEVSESFRERQTTLRRLDEPAVELHVQRAVDADALEIAATVEQWLAEVRPTLAPQLRLEQYDISSDQIADRIALLLKNGAGGLALVLVLLFLFLNARVAFWVAVGIPTSLLACMVVMWFSGQSLNMLSLFGLIMAVGIVVDDAIVVGEHAEARHAQGEPPGSAALAGAQRMLAPVASAMLTTVAAFLPLFLISGIIGTIIHAIPFVVVAVLIASLVECFLVLPNHVAVALSRPPPGGALGRFRQRFDRGFAAFRQGPFRRLVAWSLQWRYFVLCLAIATLLLAVGLLAGERVRFRFFPTPEADKIYANIEMMAGSSREQTQSALNALEGAFGEAVQTLAGDEPGLVRMARQQIGAAVGAGPGAFAGASTDTLGGMVVELAPADRRTVRTQAVIEAWRAAFDPPPGLASVSIRAPRGGPPGRDVDVRLSGASLPELKAAAIELEALMDRYEGVFGAEDDLPYGRPETILEVTPRGRALGFTTTSVGREVRNALEGAVAKRFPRGDEEVWVRVMLARASTGSGVLDDIWLRSPTGEQVPLREVVSLREDLGFARIRREDGRREVAVTAEIDPDSGENTTTIGQALERDGLREIARKYGLDYEFKGKAEEQADTFADMRLGTGLGLVSIYIILAWVLGSYLRPLVVMGIIPLGLVGAVFGHWLMGVEMSLLSLIALLGLSGIVVNDSIVLVSTIDERIERQPLTEALLDGSGDRLRAVILTSVTTIGGLLPLLFEKSLQAQFLIPMALTFCAGLAVTTAVVLVLVPCLIAIQHDVGALLRGRAGAGEGVRA